ncbi:MAG: GGDEF domain-containing protein [Gemmatimonadota bacterium]|nr:GGDEF domain-containing protein [Gemmatimonadota bacterium]
MKSFIRWLLPGGAVVAVTGWLLVTFPTGSEDLVPTITRRYAPLVYVLSGGLAVLFHRSRVLSLVVAAAVVHGALRIEVVESDAIASLGIGLVILAALAAVLRDRGVTSPGGLAQLTGLGALAATWVALARFRTARLQDWLLAGSSGPWIERVTGVSVGAVVAMGIAALALAWAVYRRGGPVERGAVWALLLLLPTTGPVTEPGAVALLWSGAVLTFGLGVLETSYAMAYRDELTGLPARRSLLRDLDGLKGTYTLAMVDVDHFKRFNDRHGHDVGDQVLRLVASRLARAPGGGKAYRYGGEEFTLLYRGLSRDAAAPHLDAVRASVAAARFSLRGWTRPATEKAGKKRRGAAKGSRPLSVTVSIGMADSKASSGVTPEAVLGKADKALYRAKRAGRNRVAR